VLRVPVSPLVSGELLLDRRASRYVARVHRLSAGDSVVLFDPAAALEATATVLEVGRGGVRCQVRDVRAAQLRGVRPVTLLQGIGKADKLDAIIRDATELGATRVVAVQTARSVVRLDGAGTDASERSSRRLERWKRIAREAARQCGRGDAPDIQGPVDLGSALALASDERAVMVCLWERAERPLGPILRLAHATPLVLLIGPEGGLEEEEVEMARRAGFVSATLGPLILRTETVAAAVLGAVLVLGAPDSANDDAK
jgi:16S rRNA (uracil1498-N3)-methyltransferase